MSETEVKSLIETGRIDETVFFEGDVYLPVSLEAIQQSGWELNIPDKQVVGFFVPRSYTPALSIETGLGIAVQLMSEENGKPNIRMRRLGMMENDPLCDRYASVLRTNIRDLAEEGPDLYEGEPVLVRPCPVK